MTGNNKFWRASLAGLASVAMLATMGVSAATAATSNAKDNRTVDVTIAGHVYNNVAKGSTYADIIADHPADFPNGVNNSTATGGYAGYTYKDQLVNLTDVAVDDAVLTPRTLTDGGKDFTVTFQALNPDGTVTVIGNVNTTGRTSADTFTVSSALKPIDQADGKILDWANAYYGPQNTPFKFDTALYRKAIADGNLTVTVPTKDAWTLTFKSQATTTGAFNVTYPGAASDGTPDGDLTIEVPAPAANGTVSYDPKDVAAALNVNAITDAPYAFVKFVDQQGKDFTADYKIAGNKWEFSPVVKEGFKVKFYDGDTKLSEQTVVSGGKVTKPADPDRKDGSTFLGWADASGKYWNFDTDTVSGATTLYAKWVGNGSYTVVYKFNDGKTADKTETYLANQNTAEPAAPARDGYIFGGWYKDNGDGVLDTKADAKFAFGSPLAGGSKTVLIANWLQANDATLQAAFAYIDGSKAENNANKYGSVFDAASFKAYVATYQKVQAEYAKAQNDATAANTQIPAETFNGLLGELVAGWKSLEFSHEGNALDPKDDSFAFRLYSSKLDEHFYSQTQDEIYGKALSALGYKVEAPLFQTVPKDGLTASTSASPADYNELGDFANIEVNGRQIAPEVAVTLNSVADPVLTTVVRFYNRETGDHVWSTDPAEQKTLSADKAWNNEGAAFYVPSYTGKTPVTRLYNPATDRHLLSVDPAEQSNLTKNAGWTVDGVVFNGI